MSRAAVVSTATAAGVAVRRALARDRLPSVPGVGRGEPEWQVLTVDRPPSEVAPSGRPPEPLARLGTAVEVRVRPAPGDRGTELAVRPTGEGLGDGDGYGAFTRGEERRELRLALRQTKQVLETGEVLSQEQPPAPRHTMFNRPLEYATRAAREGRL